MYTPRFSMIGISGKMCSGKTEFSHHLVEKYGFETFSIATPIKKICNMLIEDESYPVVHRYVASVLHDHKEQTNALLNALHEVFQTFSGSAWEKDEHGVYLKNEAYRRLTQEVGRTLREKGHPLVLIEHAAREANHLSQQGKRVVCDDLRMKEEKEIFKQAGFTIIRLDVSPEVQKQRILRLYGQIDESRLLDKTEISLDHETFDFRIDNSHISIEDSQKLIDQFLKLSV